MMHTRTAGFTLIEVMLPNVDTRCVFMSATGRPFVKKSGEGDCP